MEKKLIVIVPAAGAGKRLGLGINKAFALLRGAPLIVHCLHMLEQTKLVQRVREVTQATAAVYGATADIEISAGGPPLICDPATTDDFVKYMRELDLPGAMEYPNISASASEDFAFVAERVPSAFIYLSSGYMDERGNYSAHNPKVQFNEEVLPRGAAYLAQCAQRWLEEHH